MMSIPHWIVAAVTCTAVAICAPPAQPAAAPEGIATVVVGAEHHYEVRPGDSLTLIGARLGTDPDLIARANALRLNAIIHPGTRLLVDNRHLVPRLADDARLVLNVPQRMLFLPSGPEPFARPVAAGQPGWRTPIAPFTVVRMETHPAWHVPVSIQAEMRQKGQRVLTRVPPGPSNPLGTRYIGLSLTNIGIHGTNAPASIYRHATHGCIRMQTEDIEALYDQVQIGTSGRIIYEPVLVGLVEGRVLVEVHPDVYRRAPGALDTARRLIEASGLSDTVDWERVEVVIRERAGIARDVTRQP